MPATKTAQNQYEAMFLYPSGANAELEKTISSVRSMVEKHGGEILVLKKWDERKLTYEVKKQKRGLYIICYYTGPGSSVASIERDVNLSEEALRVLITDADHLDKSEMELVEPQPIAPPPERPAYEERGGYSPRPRRDDREGSGRDRD